MLRSPDDKINMLALTSNSFVSTIEYASRTCYAAIDGMTDDSWFKYIGARVRSGHESVIEHSMISVVIWERFGEILNDEISSLRRITSDSNSLLHWSSEEKMPGVGAGVFSLSGNIKMWRDLLKFMGTYPDDSVLTRMIASIFKILNGWNTGSWSVTEPGEGLERLFAEDIHYLYSTPTEYFKDRAFYKKMHISAESLAGKKNVHLLPIALSDENLKLNLMNADEPSISVMLLPVEARDDIPNYISDYLVRHIKDLGSVTFEVTLPRVVTQQECRHRVNSISQMSQRYINEGIGDKQNSFYEPSNVDCDKSYEVEIDGMELSLSYNFFNKLSKGLYKALENDGVKNETARFVLTNAIYSTMVVTKPYYTLDHYFKERTSSAAQYEIRLPAIVLKEYLNSMLQSKAKLTGLTELFN